MNIQYLAFFFLILVFLALFIHSQLKKETTRIEFINKHDKSVFVEAELANNATKRMKGLMFRESLDENAGMLFVFDHESKHVFWMMNTTIPLDAIHIAENGSVVDIIQMDPCNSLVFCKRYHPKEKAKFVLEVNEGFAKKNGIEIGNSKVIIKDI
jgi:uncharacterized membrane protein (UPF0127 family)